MNRKSRITAISLPKETEELLQRLQEKYHMTRSELIRVMISFYVDASKKTSPIPISHENFDSSDTNKILKLYYQLLSNTKGQPTWVIGIGIIVKKGQVVIGLRKKTDQLIKDLHWSFPTGRFSSLNFEEELIANCKTETGLTIRVGELIHARHIPDGGQKKVNLIALYYTCRVQSGKLNSGGDFKEVKWVNASEINRHFTTSVSDEVMRYLNNQ